MKFLLPTILIFLPTLVLVIKASAETKIEKNDGRPIPAETRLYQHLMAEYDHFNPSRVFRPNLNASATSSIMFGLALIAMLDYDDVNNIATFHMWERHLWKDIFLQWNPEDFDGVDQIRIPSDQIWKPDLAHYNGFDPSVKHQDARAVISYDGTVLWIPPVLRKVQCQEPTSNIIKCYLMFGSWVYDGFRINIDFYDGLEAIDITDYTSHPDYTLMSHPAKKNVKYYPCCAEPYPDLTFTMSYRRVQSNGPSSDIHTITVMFAITLLILVTVVIAVAIILVKKSQFMAKRKEPFEENEQSNGITL